MMLEAVIQLHCHEQRCIIIFIISKLAAVAAATHASTVCKHEGMKYVGEDLIYNDDRSSHPSALS